MSVLNLYLKKFTLIILALQILNLSIYNTDFYNFHTLTLVQQQNLNPVDSLAELIVESVDGYQDTFPESQNNNGKQKSDLKHNICFKMIHHAFFAVLPERNSYPEGKDDQRSPFHESYTFLFYEEINHPPS